MRPFVLEETYEVLDAIDRGDTAALCEELGDYLFEAAFLSQIAAEAGLFTMDDALRAITDKLIRRHPHVFGDAPRARTPDEVRETWERVKARERDGTAEPKTLLSGVPRALPGLLRAYQLGTRAAAVGFDWHQPADVMAKIEEEVAELREVVTAPDVDRAHAEEEMGDLLFALANLARKLDIEPESALRRANEKFSRRFTAVERALAVRGRAIHDATLDEMEAEWQQIKATEREPR
jgi:MazG family protein